MKQLVGRDAKGQGQLLQRVDRWISLSALDFADELVAETRTFRERLLRHPIGEPQLTHTIANLCTNVLQDRPPPKRLSGDGQGDKSYLGVPMYNLR